MHGPPVPRTGVHGPPVPPVPFRRTPAIGERRHGTAAGPGRVQRPAARRAAATWWSTWPITPLPRGGSGGS
ncbi:hypothetical protein D7294_14155 [Streptomyces hoynatensis]|uniref:Uncharacterized protein n=1 Tax=Streptomyces hoynatensis TaxID=1141874 RepID=A0A3A9Z009_9ACTN|nr:hypothetical protein D7294_14155 [Streptomyces hoynatensis]